MPNNDVSIIDTDENALRNIGSLVDVQTVVGNGASPVLLEQVGAADTDMLLALTRSDETNLLACKMAADFFNIPNRIARVRSSDYLDYGAEDGHIPALDAFAVTDSIHPEQLVTRHLAGLLDYVRALQVLRFAGDFARLMVVQTRNGDPLNGRSIIQIGDMLPENTNCQICAVYRGSRLIVPQPDTLIQEGDEVCFVGHSRQIATIMNVLFQREQSNRRIMIAGVGYRLAKQLENRFDIKIVEQGGARAEWLAEHLDNTLVLHGSATDEALLAREYIDEIDVFCAVTNDDENNIMAGLLAKNLGARRVISIINRSRYVDLLTGNQIDIVVSPHMITIGSVLAHIRRGDVAAVYPLRRGNAEVIEVVVHGDKKTSALVGRRVEDVKWPSGCHLAAVVRGEEVAMGRHHDLEFADGDHLVIFVTRRRALAEIEKLIQVKMGFFG